MNRPLWPPCLKARPASESHPGYASLRYCTGRVIAPSLPRLTRPNDGISDYCTWQLFPQDNGIETAATADAQVANTDAPIRCTNTEAPPQDRRFKPLVSAGDAIYGGQYRCSLGFNVVSGTTYYFLTAGHCTHSGTVTALNVTVRYQGGGTVRGMILTDVCAEPGDSGGPLYDGTKALGLTSGGSGD
jgi:hypothetical protein